MEEGRARMGLKDVLPGGGTSSVTGGMFGDASPTFLTSKIDWIINWSRRNSLWPMPFGTACCAIEMMASAASNYDLARFGSVTNSRRLKINAMKRIRAISRICLSRLMTQQQGYEMCPLPPPYPAEERDCNAGSKRNLRKGKRSEIALHCDEFHNINPRSSR